MADQSVVSVVALEVSDGKEREFLALTGQLQALVRNKGYGTNQLLQDGSHPRRYYDIRIWRNADAAAKAEGDSDINGLRRDLAKSPAVDAAGRRGVGRRDGSHGRRTVAGTPPCVGPIVRTGERRAQVAAFSGPERRTAPIAASALAAESSRSASHSAPPRATRRRRASSTPRESRASARWRRSRTSRSAPRSKPTDGRIITGCNIENSTYGLTMCAERVAIFKAISEGHRSFKRIAVVADTSQPTSPCGACRQILWEFAGNIEVILADLNNIKTTHQLKDLLPHPFDARFIE